MFLVDRALLAPGTCGICGNQNGSMVDTGVETRLSETAGRLYICRQFCVPKICEVSGALNPAASRALRIENDELEALRAELTAKIETMLPIVRMVAKAQAISDTPDPVADYATR
jgi:hypothetical protein